MSKQRSFWDFEGHLGAIFGQGGRSFGEAVGDGGFRAVPANPREGRPADEIWPDAPAKASQKDTDALIERPSRFSSCKHGNLLQQLYLEVVKIRVESRRERVVEGSCGFCIFGAAPGPIRPLPMMNPDIVPDFCLFGSFARFSFAAARRAWKACGQSLFALHSGFAFGAWIAHILATLPLVGVAFVNWRFWVRGGAASMESGGQSLFALFPGLESGAWIDHASHTLRCRRPVPVRRFPFRNSPAGLFNK